MATHLAYGKWAEEQAQIFFVNAGYTVLHTNYRTGRAEIDIIAAKGNLLVFAEVKARNNTTNGWPEVAVNKAKENLLLNAAATFIEKNNWHGDCRFDIIAVSGKGNNAQIHHIEDAFH